jgi:hypothetical protein
MKWLRIIFFLIQFHWSFSQNPINAYAAVTAILGTSLSVSSVNETYHSFENGDYVILMQMQDNVIGTNTTNVSTFGNLSSIQSAGLFEICRIQSHTESGSVPNSITLESAPVNTYSVNANASVQLITFRFLGTNFTSTANIGTLAWNGTVGGVTAMMVTSVFTLGHTISANGSGFAGGLKNTPNGYSACDNATYAIAVTNRYARKGEGIYKSTNSSFSAGRGRMLNGGGGGNDVNAGGGGGGHILSGGGGGSGWTPSGTGCSPIAGGLGGLSLSSSVSALRVFMGGGGGGGHENDGNGTVGGAGGGIVIVIAGTLTTVSCAGIAITANGTSAGTAGNDGAGGGGAGGTVIMNVNSFDVAGACQLSITANGGNGGNSNAGSGGAHGGGGGGAQGVIIYPGAQPTLNISSSTVPGNGGVSCSGCSSSLNGSAGTGPSNSGIITSGGTILPVELLDFTASLNNSGEVILRWFTAVELHAREFVLQRLGNANEVIDLATIPSRGNNSNYVYTDSRPPTGINYYRLKQVDDDGSFSFKPWIAVNANNEDKEELLLYPNPLSHGAQLFVQHKSRVDAGVAVQIFDMGSRLMKNEIPATENQNFSEINTSSLEPGVYIVKISTPEMVTYKKLLITD